MQFKRYPWKAMGSPCELHLYGTSDTACDQAAGMAKREVARLEEKFSRYRDDSLTARINASAGDPGGLTVDDETSTLLDYAETAFRESEGTFDITSGILRRAWDFRSGRVPESSEVEALLPFVGWEKVRWEKPRLVLPHREMQLDFGGYVKEYAADRVAALLREAGVANGLVDLGGDLAVVGPHPDGAPWRIGIRDPRTRERAIASIPLASGGLASSGDYERYIEVDGKRYAHILDPRTGWPVVSLRAVSVVADHCLIAGTATTVAMLLGEREGAQWLEELGLPHLRINRAGEVRGQLAPATRCASGPPAPAPPAWR
jgi:thiamine biosynthesis lipoprotein